MEFLALIYGNEMEFLIAWGNKRVFFVKFIYSEKATKFCKIFTLLLTTVHTVKSKVKISQNYVAISEYMFTKAKE